MSQETGVIGPKFVRKKNSRILSMVIRWVDFVTLITYQTPYVLFTYLYTFYICLTYRNRRTPSTVGNHFIISN